MGSGFKSLGAHHVRARNLNGFRALFDVSLGRPRNCSSQVPSVRVEKGGAAGRHAAGARETEDIRLAGRAVVLRSPPSTWEGGEIGRVGQRSRAMTEKSFSPKPASTARCSSAA